MNQTEFKQRLDAATNLNTCRPGMREYLIVCPARGEFRYFGTNPRSAIFALDASEHSQPRRNYDNVVVVS